MNIHKKQTNIPNNMNSSHKNEPVLELVLWHSVKMHWLTQLNFCLKSCCHFLKLDTEEKFYSLFTRSFPSSPMHDADEGESSWSFELAELYKKNFQKIKLLTPQIWIKVKHIFLHVAKKRVWFIIKITTSSWQVLSILTTNMLDNALKLQGEVTCWSHLWIWGLKRFNGSSKLNSLGSKLFLQ